MSDAAPSLLSLVGAAYYCLVVAASGFAAVQSKGSRPWQRTAWGAVAITFALLAIARFLAMEDVIRGALREELAAEQLYAARRELQAIAAVVLVLFAGLGGWLVWKRLAWRSYGRSARFTLIALGAALGMIGLFGLRLISLHAIDLLLFGAAKINWFLDIGLASIALICAVLYARERRSSD